MSVFFNFIKICLTISENHITDNSSAHGMDYRTISIPHMSH